MRVDEREKMASMPTNNMKKRLTLLITLTLLLTACTQEPQTLRLGTMPTYSGAIYAVGIEEGFFDDAGVEVELTVFRSARDRDAAATAGQLDGFMTDIMGAVNLNAKGFPFLMTSHEYDIFGVMTGPTGEPSSEEAAAIGIGENTIVEYIADTYLTMELNKVSIPAVPDRMGALLGGELDLGVFPQPFMGIIMGNGGSAVMSTASEDFHPVVLVFDEAYIKDNDQAVKAFYEGYQQTIDFIQSTPYEDYQEALVIHGLATEETVGMYRLPVDQWGVNPVSEEDYNAITSWMQDKGLLEAAMPFEDITETVN